MTVEATADVCDRLESLVRSCTAQLRVFGGQAPFSGVIDTVRCCEDNVLVRTALSRPGQGRVLVVDGAGSLRTALLGDQLAQLGAENGWSGVVINGAVRDVARLRGMGFGVVALGSNPRSSRKAGAGTSGEPVVFGDVVFTPGDTVYADEDGVVLVPSAAE